MNAYAMTRCLGVWLLLGLLTGLGKAQCFDLLGGGPGGFDWRQRETAHFRIIYPAHLDSVAVRAAAVAEASHVALSTWFGQPLEGKLRLYLSDADDIANGLAVPLREGYSCIWVYGHEPNAWTGTTPWLERVIPHELAHLFHYQAVRTRPAWLNLWFGRPLPRFWTEGLAQYVAETWNAQRGERWLRMAVLDDALSYKDGRSRWNGRLLYAVGHAQARWLAWQQGDSTLRRILKHRSRRFGWLTVHDFYEAFRAVTGISYHTFYERWRRHLNVLYNTMAGQMETPDSLRGDTLAVPVAYVDDLALSPDMTRWAVLGMPSMARPVRTLYVGRPGHWRAVAEGDIRPPIAWSPDGRYLAFARRARSSGGGLVYDLWLVSIDGHLQRLTHGRRAFSPAFAPDGRRLAFAALNNGAVYLGMLDLEKGAVRLLKAFPRSVKIGAIRWSPDGRALLFDRLVEGVRRDLVRWEPDADSLVVLTDGRHDDRTPVGGPDGRRLAFTSLRDGVPNVFMLDLTSGQVARVTHLVSGARVLSWLPPSPGFPEGQLAIAVTLSKHAEVVRLIDARRRATNRPVVVPEPYRTWMGHMAPSRRMLDTLMGLPVAVSPSKPYRSWAHLTHVASWGMPYYLGRIGAGIGGGTFWLEPLGSHIIVAGGMFSVTRPFYSVGGISYLSRRIWGMVGGTIFRMPGTLVFYDNGLFVEVQTGGELMLRRDFTAPPYGRRWGSLRLRYRDRRPLWPRHPERLHGLLPPPASGRQLDVTLTVHLKRRRPYRYNAVHPLDGEGVRLQLLEAVPALGAKLQFRRLDVAAYRLWPVVGSHRLLTYGRVQVQHGRSLPQDYLGLSRLDALHLLLPRIEAEVFAPVVHERVRGYRRQAVGRTVLFGTMEYRMLLFPDLQTQLLGRVRLGATALAAFADGAVVRGGMETERLGIGIELKNALHLGPLVLTHVLGWAYPLRSDEPGARREFYYRIRAAVPF